MRNYIRKVSALLLTLVIALSFMPAMTLTAYAGGSYDLSGIIKGGDSSGNVIAGQQIYILESDLDACYGGTSIRTMWNNNEVELFSE